VSPPRCGDRASAETLPLEKGGGVLLTHGRSFVSYYYFKALRHQKDREMSDFKIVEQHSRPEGLMITSLDFDGWLIVEKRGARWMSDNSFRLLEMLLAPS
jgi:hypothetical protein